MAFLQSSPAIYDTMIMDGVAKDYQKEDLITLLAPVRQQGFYWDAKTGKLTSPGKNQWATETPWIHQKHGHTKRCGFDHHLCFNLYGIIPHRCLECWKVVVSPRTFKELMALRELQKEQNVPSKCGIEVRDYTPKHYGGYYYNDSLDEGIECYHRVKKDVAEHINKEVADGVLLKRGCTEYEFIKGPSPQWHMKPEECKMYEILENYVEQHTLNGRQSEPIQLFVWYKWMLWAHMNGDFTYTDWNGGKKLFPDYVTYHDKDLAKMKQELALAKMHALYGVKGEQGKEVLAGVFDAAVRNDVDPNAVFSMGFNTQNVVNFQPISDIPEETKGDLDELT